MLDKREIEIIDFIKSNDGVSSKEIFDNLQSDVSYATLKRILKKLSDEQYLAIIGKGRGTKYTISPTFGLLAPIEIDRYFAEEIDERQIKEQFNPEIITKVLSNYSLFTAGELEKLEQLQAKYKSNISKLNESEYKNELERLAIDLSWKSSQIEGNTYSLLETELLLKEKETATGKTREEATMLLNHKDAIDFIVANPNYLSPISVARIEDIHSLLVKELGIGRNLRKRRVGISGTNYRPLDNEFQIIEALENTCKLINSKTNTFEKSLLALVLISYIQPFVDGNKRTARIVSNALLMDDECCPISYRTVDSLDYKKAMLVFYEQNNISSFKKIYIDQYEFAVDTYF